MSDHSAIQWTEATWNPVTGCTKVSPGCDHCYAERLTERFHGKGSFAEVKLHPDRLDQPLRWRKPRRVFVNSMSDLFHNDVPDDFIADVFAVMSLAPEHTFQVLTKRHGRMRSLLSRPDFEPWVRETARGMKYGGGYSNPRMDDRNYQTWPLPNVWLGVSVEDQKWADIRVPALLETPAAVRFLSCEPLLRPVDLRPEWTELELMAFGANGAACFPRIDWVIVGGDAYPDECACPTVRRRPVVDVPVSELL